MYDIIRCEYPLPLSGIDEDDLTDIEKSMGELSWPKIDWQTKDFDNNLDIYTIEDDGQVYRKDTQWVLDAGSNRGMSPTEGGEIQKYEKTAEVIFSYLFLGDDFDYWVEFKAVFWKGDLKEIDLHEFSREDNVERKKHQKEMLRAIGELHDKDKSKLRKVYTSLVKVPLELFRRSLAFFISLSMRLERWLT